MRLQECFCFYRDKNGKGLYWIYIYNRCFSACTCRFVRLKIRCHACLNRHTTMWDHKPETLNKTTQNRRQENHWNTLFFAFVNQCDAVRSHQIQRLCKPVTSWSDTMFQNWFKIKPFKAWLFPLENDYLLFINYLYSIPVGGGVVPLQWLSAANQIKRRRTSTKLFT